MRDQIDQLGSVAEILAAKPGSRRAVVQLFNAEDIASAYKEIPCTTTLQFHLRDGRLHMSVTLRSNDAYWGLPHDIFCFTMIQEMMARRLNVELGEYYQYVGSMHIYVDKIEAVKVYMNEGHQRAVAMPAMPEGDPFLLVPALLAAEEKIRHGEAIGKVESLDSHYWADILRLLEVFWAKGDRNCLQRIRQEFASPLYHAYLDGRAIAKSPIKENRTEV